MEMKGWQVLALTILNVAPESLEVVVGKFVLVVKDNKAYWTVRNFKDFSSLPVSLNYLFFGDNCMRDAVEAFNKAFPLK